MQKEYNYIARYIDERQSHGLYTFSFSDIQRRFPEILAQSLKVSLSRMRKKGRIVLVRAGFYIIVPPEYAAMGALPPALYVDDLMKYLDKNYYVGLLSAAALHGAGHQQPQQFFIITVKPTIRDIRVKDTHLHFHFKSQLPAAGIRQFKTDMGYIQISGPELTAIDLVLFENKIGGLSRVVEILAELEDFDLAMLSRIMQGSVPLSCLQRLGYLFDVVLSKHEIADVIYHFLQKRHLSRVPLVPSGKRGGVSVHPKWHVFENIDLEVEL